MGKYFFKKVGLIFIMGGTFLLILVYLWLISPMTSPDNDVLSDNNYYIAHAAGAIDGNTYLNCKEALLQSLDNGYKYIELDLAMTADSTIVCAHDWEHFHKIAVDCTINMANPLSEQEFQQSKILGKYTPLTLEKAIRIRKNHPYIIVTDKISEPQILNRYFVGDRSTIMVEAFTISDYEELKKAGYIPMISLWHFDYSSIFWDFIYYPLRYHQRIDWICIHSSSNMKAIRMLKRLFNCKVAMYTSNSPSFFKDHLGKEIDLVYTDNWNMKTKTNNDTLNIRTY